MDYLDEEFVSTLGKLKMQFAESRSLDGACKDDQRQTLIVSLCYQFRY